MTIPEGYHRHPNGGGMVRNGVEVPESVYVGTLATIKGGTIYRGSIYGGTICRGEILGGIIYGGIIYGGTICGGEIRGGEVFGGSICGGAVCGGEILGGTICGGSICGGTIRGGAIRGGAIYGGTICGGEIRGGIIYGGTIYGGTICRGEILGGEVFGGTLIRNNSDILYLSGMGDYQATLTHQADGAWSLRYGCVGPLLLDEWREKLKELCEEYARNECEKYQRILSIILDLCEAHIEEVSR